MIPKVVFRYSWIYDEMISKGKLLSHKEMILYISKVEKMWRRKEKDVLRELSRITGLKWKEKEIKCYIVTKTIPFSDPITIPIYKKYPDYFIDVLIHELIHQLYYIQNIKESKKSWKYIYDKYKREPRKTRIHIPLHAMHKHIYLKFFNEKRLNRDKNKLKVKDYKRAWDIVERDGYENIIKEFRNRIKKC